MFFHPDETLLFSIFSVDPTFVGLWALKVASLKISERELTKAIFFRHVSGMLGRSRVANKTMIFVLPGQKTRSYVFDMGDALSLEIDETDILFLDTWHVYLGKLNHV